MDVSSKVAHLHVKPRVTLLAIYLYEIFCLSHYIFGGLLATLANVIPP